jgi:hypothetical protein
VAPATNAPLLSWTVPVNFPWSVYARPVTGSAATNNVAAIHVLIFICASSELNLEEHRCRR